MANLAILSERRSGGTVLTLRGALTIDEGAALEREIARLVETKPTLVAVDLSGLSFISSGGIAALVNLHHGLKACGGRARLAAPPPTITGVLESAHLTALMPVFPNVEAALRAG
jgi:stage II sporulation protein AA (anti-sigma F factor antagonist)